MCNKDWYNQGKKDGAVQGAVVATVVIGVLALLFKWRKK
jgi:multisubunit Na+/H+ antiporter MnhB subunit